MANGRIRKKVGRRLWTSNSKNVDCYGDRFSRYRYVDHEGKVRFCRAVDFMVPDPMTDACGCVGDFIEDFERQDARDGCPKCIDALMP